MSIKISKKLVSGLGKSLTAVALFFASAPCWGHLYEPEIPECLQRKLEED